MKKQSNKGEFRPSYHTKSNTHGFTVVPDAYENKWDHIPVKETTQRLINISKTHRKRNKTKLCFTTSTRSIPMRALHKPSSNRPSSAPATPMMDSPIGPIPTPPLGGKTIYSTRKIRSAVPRVNVADKKEEVREAKSPTFELTRTPTGNIGVKVQIQDDDTLGRLKEVEAEKIINPDSELTEEIERLKQHIVELESKIELDHRSNREKQQLMQIEFNKNLAQTLNEKKKELKQLKEMHYGEICGLKHKMNDALKMQRNESSFVIAKLKGEMDSNRETYKNSSDKLKMRHSEELQDLHSDLNLKHQTEKTKLLRDLEEKLIKEKELALETLKNKLEADITLLKQQHSQEVEEILKTFEGISLEEVDSNRALIQEQELQIICYKRAQRKMEEDMRSIMNELASHKSALKQLQESFFDKVHEVDQKYNQQLSSLLVDNKDLRKRYLKKCDELFTLKAAYNRLQEAKGYIAKEMLSALMQGKQPHVITSSAVKASWSTDGLDCSRRCSSVARSISDGGDLFDRSPSACSVEDKAALMLSTCSYIQDNSQCTRNPRPLSESIFSKDDFPFSLSHASSEGNLSTISDTPPPPGRISRVRSVSSVLEDPLAAPMGPVPSRRHRPVSSVCVVRPHSRQSLQTGDPLKPRATSADPRSRSLPINQNKLTETFDSFNLPALPTSPQVRRREAAEQDSLVLHDLDR
ncbi:vimentin-like isoform X2 [Bolinopsis microptera]|uniref:vimentin-like isoform X2 n=1 Tax=Bolinopsis microptera TaxID=2820187 RepID=UPI0030796042